MVSAFSQPKVDFVLDSIGCDGEQRSMLELGAGNGFLRIELESLFLLTVLDFSRNLVARNPIDVANVQVASALRNRE